MRVAIVGSRTITDLDYVLDGLNKLIEDGVLPHESKWTAIVSGGAAGVDTLAKHVAIGNDIELIEFHANWEKHGKSAGFIRNNLIVSNCDVLVAFIQNNSKGTAHSINRARMWNIPTYVFSDWSKDYVSK